MVDSQIGPKVSHNDRYNSAGRPIPGDRPFLNGKWTEFMSRLYPKHFTMYASHSPIHTPTAIGCHARYQPSSSGAIRGRHAQGGIEPATLRLPDDSSYLPSHLLEDSTGVIWGIPSVQNLSRKFQTIEKALTKVWSGME